MVVRKRLRAILYPVVLYLCCGVASSYFVYTALNGERGLKTKAEYKRQILALQGDLDGLKGDRAELEHRIDLMRSEAIDADMLHEEARATLGYVDPRDLVVFLNRDGKP